MGTDTGHRVAVIVGSVAAAAGVAATAYVLVRRARAARRAVRPLRTVREVLSDCYDRMREIQQDLANIGQVAG